MLMTGKDGKECRVCKEWKPFTAYSKRKDAKDNVRSDCKVCQASRNKKNLDKVYAKNHKVTLVIPDLQAPFHHPDALPFLKAVRDMYKPDEYVSGGDELDLYCLNDYGRDPNYDNPEGEFYKGRAFMQQFFKEFPEGVGVTSNHVHGRIERKRQGARILKQWLKSFEDMIGAPEGWEWVDEYETQGTLIRHGHADGKSPKGNLEKVNHYRMFEGEKPLNLLLCHHHTELGSKDVLMGQHIVQFGFCGSLIDKNSHAFKYTNKPPALGCMLIRDGRHFPIVMYIDKDGRWTGEL